MTLHINDFFDEVTKTVIDRMSNIRDENEPIIIEGPEIRAKIEYSNWNWKPIGVDLTVTNHALGMRNKRKVGVHHWDSQVRIVHKVSETIKATLKYPVIDHSWGRAGQWDGTPE